MQLVLCLLFTHRMIEEHFEPCIASYKWLLMGCWPWFSQGKKHPTRQITLPHAVVYTHGRRLSYLQSSSLADKPSWLLQLLLHVVWGITLTLPSSSSSFSSSQMSGYQSPLGQGAGASCQPGLSWAPSNAPCARTTLHSKGQPCMGKVCRWCRKCLVGCAAQ